MNTTILTLMVLIFSGVALSQDSFYEICSNPAHSYHYNRTTSELMNLSGFTADDLGKADKCSEAVLKLSKRNEINLKGLQLTKTAPITSLFSDVEHINLAANFISRVEDFSEFYYLKSLDLSYNRLRSIDDISALPSEEETFLYLILRGNRIHSFRGVSELPSSLEILDLSENKIVNWDDASQFPANLKLLRICASDPNISKAMQESQPDFGFKVDYECSEISNISMVHDSIEGGDDLCIILKSGSISCNDEKNSELINAAGNIDFIDLANSKTGHSCAVLANGQVSCWGSGSRGQLGNGELADSKYPVTVKNIAGTGPLLNVKEVAVGAQHTCALLENQTVKCWGLQGDGLLGNGKSEFGKVSVPTAVDGIDNAIQIATGGSHSCALLDDQGVKCWGYGGAGQLGVWGVGSYPESLLFHKNLPVTVMIEKNVRQLALGRSVSCALMNDKTVQCWGGGSKGKLGRGDTEDGITPSEVKNLTNVKKIVVGDSHSCALMEDKTVKCWGSAEDGRLGVGASNDQLIPANVIYSQVPFAQDLEISSAKDIAVGLASSCALLEDDSIFCWGRGYSEVWADGTSRSGKFVRL